MSIDEIKRVKTIISSIVNCKIPTYEIIVIGKIQTVLNNAKVVYVDCDKASKKNMALDHASYDTIVLMTDYVKLHKNWYNGLCAFGDDFDILMNRIVNKRKVRYIDWVWSNPAKGAGRNVNYHISDHQGMFVPGVFSIMKKYVLEKYRFVPHHRNSDTEWSKRALQDFSYRMNVNSRCVVIHGGRRYPLFRRPCACSVCNNLT